MKHLFIVNPKPFLQKAGLERVLIQIESVCKTCEDIEYEIYISQYPRDAVGVIKKKLMDMPPDKKLKVYAVGGDGILFDCLNGVAGSNAELAAMPYGGANDFLRNFGENKLTVFRNLSFYLKSKTVLMDIFSCNNSYAFNYCAIGIEGAASLFANRVMEVSQNKLTIIPNCLLYVYKLGEFAALFDKTIREQEYSIIIDGVDYSGSYSSVIIANGQCFGCNKIASSSAQLNDGFLNIVFLKKASALKQIMRWSAFRKGKIEKHPQFFSEVRGKKISIRAEGEPLHICLDGEAFRETSLDVEIIPASVSFAVPQSISYSEGTGK